MPARPSGGADFRREQVARYLAAHPQASSREVQRAVAGRRQDILADIRSLTGRRGQAVPELRERGYRPEGAVAQAIRRAKATPTRYLQARYARESPHVLPRPESTRRQRPHESRDHYNAYLRRNRAEWQAWNKSFNQPWADRQELERRIGRQALKGKEPIRERVRRARAEMRIGQMVLGPKPWGESPGKKRRR